MVFKSKLDVSRKELLDLTLRNPLLNYRTLKSKGLDIVDEKAEELYRLLVTEGKTMTFLPSEKRVVAEEALEKNELDEEAVKSLNQTYSDLKLQTGYTEGELQTRLLATHLDARTFIEERGVNTLFLALGMLCWKDAPGSEKVYRAPLILVPVNLERASIKERFVLRYSEEDVLLNVSLESKLKEEYDLNLIYEQEEISVLDYFSFVEEKVSVYKEWQVDRAAIALGFFSFSKYLMYLDLDMSKWPEDTRINENPVIMALLEGGFSEPEAAVSESDYLDPVLEPSSVYHVVDADSSQTLAILDVNSGRNLVIQGPPGTGKSQTITNIISESVARGKKVIFVSEKLAALEVVKRRLTNVGLGDVCLELHSNKANKKDLLKELKRTMELGKPVIGDSDKLFEQYTRLRNDINKYCTCVNEPIEPSKVSPIVAYGKLLSVKRKEEEMGAEVPRLLLEGVLSWDDRSYQERYDKVLELREYIGKIGLPKEHPFWGSRLRLVVPGTEEEVARLCKTLLTQLCELKTCEAELVNELHINSPNSLKYSNKLYDTINHFTSVPKLQGISYKDTAWHENSFSIEALLEAGKIAAGKYKKHEALLLDNSWEQDVFPIRQALSQYVGKWWKVFSGVYRNACRQFNGLLKQPSKTSVEEKLAVLDDILAFRKSEKLIYESKGTIEALFKQLYLGITATDWEHLGLAAEWLKLYYEKLSQNSFYDITAYLLDEDKKKAALGWVWQLSSKQGEAIRSIDEFIRKTSFDSTLRFGRDSWYLDMSYIEVSNQLEVWSNNADTLNEIAIHNQYADRLDELGIGIIAEKAAGSREFAATMMEALERTRYEALLTKAYETRTILTTFDSAKHKLTIDKFVDSDKKLIKHNVERLLYKHWDGIPQQGGVVQGQIGILLREFQKKSRHLPIRRLISSAGNAIQAIKPVMMMSPLSIANFIEPGHLSYDLVIFDEASQVKPVEAFGALMRGKQAVVVGDSQQMPPTSFFDRVISGEEEEQEETEGASLGDYESILKLFLAQNAPERTLRWHYRSRHESLIAVSNKEFYDNRLMVFPSVESSRKEIGLIFNHLKQTAYDRGGSRTNKEEARIVAERVIQHAKNTPELTLGVAAFSIAQMKAIINQLEIMRRNDPAAEVFFQSHKEEPFFVKNLENIQGDERDVIFISVGYGKTADGSLSMEFGPLNREGGERRLNVLITRARGRCEVFSNITGDDINTSKTASRGVECLKNFLTYAEKGILDVPKHEGEQVDSIFEQEVYYKLTQKGYQVKKQIGCAGFYIDLAIIDPENPGRYLLGIECDGAAYHSSRSARDRDRLRQAVLESKGWTIYRIWSTDWFRSPKRELERLEEFLSKLKEQTPACSKASSECMVEVVRSEDCVSMSETSSGCTEPYQVYFETGISNNVFEREYELRRLVSKVVRHESPVHKDEVLRRIVALAGSTRAGSKMKSAYEVVLSSLVRSGSVAIKEEFIFDKSVPVRLRSRAEYQGAYRKLEYIAKEEIMLAVKKALELSYGMSQSDIPLAAAKLLGFQKTSEDMQQLILRVIEEMEISGSIKKQGEGYIV